jgi:DUF2934 family protein
MDHNLEHRIRERAYEIWTAHGCINGQADQHWLAAEREVLTELTTPVTPKQTMRQKGRPRAFSKSRKAIAG